MRSVASMKIFSFKKYIKLFTLLFLFAPLPAEAAAIQNLSCNPQTIEVPSANGFQAMTIPPGKTYDVAGDMKVRYRDREVTVEYDMEYVIWNDGTFGPQRRNRSRSGTFGHNRMR